MPVRPIPEHVHTGEASYGGAVLLNSRSGQWHAMNGTAHALWEEWRRSGDFDTAVLALADRYPQIRYDTVRLDAERLAGDLVARGLVAREPLVRGPVARGPVARGPAARDPVARDRPAVPASVPALAPEPGPAQDLLPPRPGATGRPRRASALLGLAAALCLVRLPFRLSVRLVGALKRYRCRRPASLSEAESVLTAVRRAGGRYPGRFACLEDSLGTVLGLALAGLRADWCLGSADDPYRFHAWVEVGGETVTHLGDVERVPFRSVLVL